ncbi:MAG: GGDEF domain-containing protein [Rhizomicrobium sp.]
MATNEHERAQTLAKMAFALMNERHVSPTPGNFQLFYTYVAGENPAATQVFGELIATRAPLPPQLLEELRQRFFGTAHLESAVENIGTEITDTVASMLARLEAAERDTMAYGRTLSAASGELGGAHSADGLQKLVGGLLNATRAMETRTKNLETELQRSAHEVSELRTKLDDVRKESLTDPLTGIANRKAFDTELADAIKHSRENDEPLSLLMGDIDHFKKFNDTWGHQTGDQVLRLVAGCLSENVKGRDTAARYGGEEFAVILRNTQLSGAVNLADQIRLYVERKKLVKKSTGDILGRISISVGVAQLGPDETRASLIRRADACLYAAKSAGRNCVISDAGPSLGQDVVAA